MLIGSYWWTLSLELYEFNTEKKCFTKITTKELKAHLSQLIVWIDNTTQHKYNPLHDAHTYFGHFYTYEIVTLKQMNIICMHNQWNESFNGKSAAFNRINNLNTK